jgi:cysteinyl-tRNA synthetase
VVAYNKLVAKIAAIENEGDLEGEKFEKYRSEFVSALDNDINTSLAVTAVYDVLKANTNDKTKLYLLADFDKVLSLDLIEGAKKLSETKEEPQGEKDELTLYVEEQIALRAAAKKEKNFAEADRIRNELLEKGIKLLDTREGTTWSKE